MKKIIVFVALLLALANVNTIMAQRHIKGVQSFEITGGYFGKGYYGAMAYSRYLNSKLYVKVGVLSEYGKIKTLDGVNGMDTRVKYNTQYLDASIYYSLLNIRDKVFISPSLGLSGAYEKVQQLQYAPKQGGIIYGFMGGLETEFFISDKFVFLIEAKQRYYFRSDFGAARYNIGGGLKYNF